MIFDKFRLILLMAECNWIEGRRDRMVPITTKVVSSNHTRATLCDKVCQWLGGRSVVLSGYSGFLHQQNWPQRYNWNIVESAIKYHNPDPPLQIRKTLNIQHLSKFTNFIRMKTWKEEKKKPGLNMLQLTFSLFIIFIIYF